VVLVVGEHVDREAAARGDARVVDVRMTLNDTSGGSMETL
jgi:hypothetical protein